MQEALWFALRVEQFFESARVANILSINPGRFRIRQKKNQLIVRLTRGKEKQTGCLFFRTNSAYPIVLPKFPSICRGYL